MDKFGITQRTTTCITSKEAELKAFKAKKKTKKISKVLKETKTLRERTRPSALDLVSAIA